MNSGRRFTEPQSREVNILPLFTEIEKNNCFSIYTGSDLDNIFRRKPLKTDLIDLSIHAWKTYKRFKASKVIKSKTLVCKIVSLLLPPKTFIPNFVAFFVFSGTASSCILRFLIPKHWRNASLHPQFCFCLACALFTR